MTLIKLGLCTVRASQSESDFYEAAQPVEVSITISDTRTTSDQPDTVTGFQIKAMYVVPSDGAWKSLGAGSHVSDLWGPKASWPCPANSTAPWKQLTVTTPGIGRRTFFWIMQSNSGL